MLDSKGHIPDQDLLLALDGELPDNETVQIQSHLAACWACRARMRKLEDTITDFVSGYRERLDSSLPSVDGPRALLKARLSSDGSSVEPPNHALLSGMPKVAAIACMALVLGAALLMYVRSRGVSLPPRDNVASDYDPRLSPVAALTPGSTVFISKATLCDSSVTNDEAQAPPIPRAAALAVFREYGIQDPQPGMYELDYLIAPELGGSADVRNLWPQPYSGTWNAHLKDALEDRLREMVCDGRMDLETAQREIAADWIAAYKKYFRTEEPLSAHARFLKDSPWQ
ncbi:MAG: anti-sigma factor [Candidatus Korobacteraceae bacterium]